MKNFYPVIDAHVKYVLAMRVVFEMIFRILLPRRKSTADFFGCKEQFLTILDEEFAKIDLSTATVEDYRLALEDVCLNDVEQAIEFLFSLCKDVGFERYANRYLNKFQFAKMMCDCDKEKLAKLEAIVDSGDTNLGRVFMRIGGVLDGRENAYEDLDESAKAKAAEDVQKVVNRAGLIYFQNIWHEQDLIEDKAEGVQKAPEIRAEKAPERGFEKAIQEKLSSIDSKLESIEVTTKCIVQTMADGGPKRGHKREHNAGLQLICLHCWECANANIEVKNSVNTRVSYKAAYAYYKPKLEPLGIHSEKDFRRELHKIYSRNSKRKAKELEAKRMGKAKPTSYTKISPANQAKYGTIEAMKTTKHSASITTQDFGGVKSCTEAAQNAAVRASCIPPPAISKAA